MSEAVAIAQPPFLYLGGFMPETLYLAIGVDGGTALSTFENYRGGQLDDDSREALHRSLDHLITVANSRISTRRPKTHAISRRR